MLPGRNESKKKKKTELLKPPYSSACTLTCNLHNAKEISSPPVPTIKHYLSLQALMEQSKEILCTLRPESPILLQTEFASIETECVDIK